jgi:hypothetical protein
MEFWSPKIEHRIKWIRGKKVVLKSAWVWLLAWYLTYTYEARIRNQYLFLRRNYYIGQSIGGCLTSWLNLIYQLTLSVRCRCLRYVEATCMMIRSVGTWSSSNVGDILVVGNRQIVNERTVGIAQCFVFGSGGKTCNLIDAILISPSHFNGNAAVSLPQHAQTSFSYLTAFYRTRTRHTSSVW